jgi:phosphatidylglycerol:prolipoprotein diacylglycerol transferase
MYPDLNLGPVTLHTFGLMFALAFLAAGAVVGRRLKEIGKPTDWAYEIIFCGLAGGAIRISTPPRPPRIASDRATLFPSPT